MIWICGWPLIFLHLFIHEPYREIVIAAQTFICTILYEKNIPTSDPIFTITLFVVLTYFAQSEHAYQHMSTFIMHHIIVVLAILTNYIAQEWKVFIWCILLWSIRWLSSMDIYTQTPIRVSCRFFMFFLLSREPFGSSYKWYWVLIVHEFAWFLIPVQMLYEVYKNKKIPNGHRLNKEENV